MRYKAYRPDTGQTLCNLATTLQGPICCHKEDMAALIAAGVNAESLLPGHGGPLRGEIWVPR